LIKNEAPWKEGSNITAAEHIGMRLRPTVSAAVGIVLALALIRGFARREASGIGNFWVDLREPLYWIRREDLTSICRRDFRRARAAVASPAGRIEQVSFSR
jgi:hypothetical protein